MYACVCVCVFVRVCVCVYLCVCVASHRTQSNDLVQVRTGKSVQVNQNRCIQYLRSAVNVTLTASHPSNVTRFCMNNTTHESYHVICNSP